MTIPFWCVGAAIVIPYLLAFTGVYFKNQQFGTVDNKNPRLQAAGLEGVGARAAAAQANAWEALPVFTAAVVIAHLAGAAAGAAAIAALVWLGARVLHAIFYLADLDILRSLAFVVSMLCNVSLFVLAA